MNKTILIIEDELFLREMYVKLLEKAGYKVLAAYDGVEGLALVRSHPDADLVLLDIMLPKMHGVEVLRKMKADAKTKNIPVVILSNLSEEKILAETLKLGAKGYLVKVHVAPENLIEKVKGFLELSQLNRET